MSDTIKAILRENDRLLAETWWPKRDPQASPTAEVKYLRALCGEALRHPWRVSLVADAGIQRRLDRAEKGEV